MVLSSAYVLAKLVVLLVGLKNKLVFAVFGGDRFINNFFNKKAVSS